MTSGGASEQLAQAAEILVPLAEEATVRIHGAEAGNPLLGSGFFVAPNWVLTCAHVARAEGEVTLVGAPRKEVRVGFRDELLAGVVEWAQPSGPAAAGIPGQGQGRGAGPGGYGAWPGEDRGPGAWAAPDLALIRLVDPLEHPCVWLTERTAKGYTTNPVAYFGWLPLGGVPMAYNGRCVISGQLGVGGGGLLRLSNDDEMPQGLSGGPVVDLVRGEVIGVLQARRAERDGGLAVSIQQLRQLPAGENAADDLYHRVMTAHDLYHADHHRFLLDRDFYGWTEAHSEIGAAAGRALTPGRRTALLGLLAQLPPPAGARALGDLVTEVRGGAGQGFAVAPRAWRDGLGLLYDLRRGSELEAVLRYAVLAASAERVQPAQESDERAVWEWAQATAADQGLSMLFRNSLIGERMARLRARGADAQSPGPGPRTRGEAQLEIIPRGWEPDRFDWRVTVSPESGEVDCVHEDFRGTSVADLPALLAAPLAEAFRRCDEPGYVAALQLAVPGSLMAFAADTWRLDPDGSRLGAIRPVVVRRTDPPQDADPGVAEERLSRWHTLHRRPPSAEVLDCGDSQEEPLPEDAELRARPREMLPVLCRSGAAAPEALHRLLRCGYSVALWRREPIEPERVCSDLHRGVPRLVHGARTAAGLPAGLAALRAAVADGVPEAFWSGGLALLYDDPTRPLPGTDELLETP
ncbi:Trypsin-like peptidase domain-containing protein [Actinacidiphila yanglinensis]|uniref:Trypsin-like peptidase domain-containing protein n=1 Tax=Actinacidiphila yanglinensis TaxID=310779 RepID=A0A1H5VJJ2_9ACTN|nr:trypsin-like peptidase domain-containing protein [Actinacidiphila yanglinensis]SEF86717.1 Trypsin-like peptidase domain-containing protein [Actinacidiphila yanglinensis]